MYVNLFGAESAAQGGGRVMVHCEAGRSRSATICIQCNYIIYVLLKMSFYGLVRFDGFTTLAIEKSIQTCQEAQTCYYAQLLFLHSSMPVSYIHTNIKCSLHIYQNLQYCYIDIMTVEKTSLYNHSAL